MSKLFSVVHVDPDESTESRIGDLEVAPDGLLSVIAAEEGCEEFLQQFVDSLNDQVNIQVKMPGKARYAVSSKTYERDAPDFLEGMKQYVKHYYSIELRSNEDFADSDEFTDL